MVPPKNGFLSLRLPIFGASYFQCFYTFGIAHGSWGKIEILPRWYYGFDWGSGIENLPGCNLYLAVERGFIKDEDFKKLYSERGL